MNAAAAVEHGRKLYVDRAWSDAYAALSGADREAPLAADDLELLATAAYMIGRQDEYFSALGRAHQAHLNAGEALHAARVGEVLGQPAGEPRPLLGASRRRWQLRRALLPAELPLATRIADSPRSAHA